MYLKTSCVETAFNVNQVCIKMFVDDEDPITGTNNHTVLTSHSTLPHKYPGR